MDTLVFFMETHYIFSAILVLERGIDFDEFIKPICMPHWALRPYKKYEATIAGWGMEKGETWVSNLKETPVLIWSQEFCSGTMEREHNHNKWHTVTKYCCSLFWEKRLTLKVYFLDPTCALGQFSRTRVPGRMESLIWVLKIKVV